MKIKCQGKEKHFFLSPDIFCSLDNSVGLPNLIPGDIWQCLETSFIVTAEICVCVCVCVCVSYQHVVNGNLVSWQTLCNARDHSTTPFPAVNYGTPNVNRAEAQKTWDNLMNDKQPHIPKVQMLHWSMDTSRRPWKDGIDKSQSHSRNMRIR